MLLGLSHRVLLLVHGELLLLDRLELVAEVELGRLLLQLRELVLVLRHLLQRRLDAEVSERDSRESYYTCTSCVITLILTIFREDH